jgi:hypothetical protein
MNIASLLTSIPRLPTLILINERDVRSAPVRGFVAVEPNGPPAHDVDFKGAPDWFADNSHIKPYGLADVPLAYDPPVSDAAPLAFVREEKPEKPTEDEAIAGFGHQKALDGALQRRRLAADQGIAILVDTVPDVVFERAVDIAGADGADRRQQSGQAHRGRGGFTTRNRAIIADFVNLSRAYG